MVKLSKEEKEDLKYGIIYLIGIILLITAFGWIAFEVHSFVLRFGLPVVIFIIVEAVDEYTDWWFEEYGE